MLRDGIGIVLYFDLRCLRYRGGGVTYYKFCSVLGTMFCGDLVSHCFAGFFCAMF